ncbi:hypothetical protein HOY82DRAFT_631582 [Tuber indicum]|nr:hypothetical protein HOY82DRAFT_631582 [Tuber indicum]
MFFSRSTFVALIGAIAVAAEFSSSAFPEWTGTRQSSKSVSGTGYLTTSGNSRFTLTPTVATHPNVQTATHPQAQAATHPQVQTATHPQVQTATHPQVQTAMKYGEPIMRDRVPHPSFTLTLTSSRGSKNVSRTMSLNRTSTRFPVAPIITGNATSTRPTGTATPSNGTNRTTSGTATRMPSSLGSTITPYGTAFLAIMIGFFAMGF